MIFNSLAFLVFAAVVVPLFWALRSDRWRLPVLFAANFVFYGWWDWRFTSLLLAVVVIAWGWGIWIGRAKARGGGARAVLLCGCAVQLAVLGYFKYAGFFAENLRSALGAVGWEPGWTTLNILLPAGVSFLHFSSDQLSGFGLQWVGGSGAEFFADGGVSGIFSASGCGADHSGAFVFAATGARAGFRCGVVLGGVPEICDRLSLQGGFRGQYRGGDQSDLGIVGVEIGYGDSRGVCGVLRADLF